MFDGFADHRFYNQNTFNFWAHLAISAEIAHFGKDRNWHARLPIPGCGTTSSIMTISASRGFGRLPGTQARSQARWTPRTPDRADRRRRGNGWSAPRVTRRPTYMHPAGERYTRLRCESPP